MAKKLNLTQYPYFDDYKESNKYYQILFRPGRAVQARELTQLQTILQNQIERFGTHIFKQGSNVIPGTANAVRYTKTVHYIKLALRDVYPEYNPSTSSSEDIHTAIKQIWVGNKIGITSGTRAGISATIKGYRGPDQINNGEVRFFLDMESSSNDGASSTFEKGDIVTLLTGERLLAARIPSQEGFNKVGVCSSVQVEEGVYFYNGYFVYVDGQTIYLGPTSNELSDTELYQNLWNDLPTATVGLLMKESVKTSQQDNSLVDNARGSPNFSAPGADRFHIDAVLTQIDYDPTATKPENFVSLLDVSSGRVFFIADAPDYAALADTLARRTYDESGDYIVENLGVQVTDFLFDQENQVAGAHQLSEFQFTTENQAIEFAKNKFGVILDTAIAHPSSGTIGVNRFYYPGKSYDDKNDPKSFKRLCQSLLSLRIDPGKAYVKGYEIRKLAKSTVDVPKSRTTKFTSNSTVSTSIGSHIVVTDVAGNISIANFANVDFYNLRRKGTSKKSGTGTGSGTAYVPAEFVYETSVRTDATKIGSGKIVKIEADPDAGAGYYRVYLTDVSFVSGYSVENIKTVYSSSEQFIAHAELQQASLTGSIQKTAVGTGYDFVGTATGWKNFPGEILKVNDYVWLDGNSSGQQQFYRVKSIQSDSSIDLESEDFTTTTSLGKSGIIASTTIKSLYSTINNDAEESGLLFRLGQNYVSTVRTTTASGSIDTSTTNMQYVIEELDAGETGTGRAPSVQNINGTNYYAITLTRDDTHKYDSNEYTYKVVKKNTSGTKTLMTVENGASTPTTAGTVNVFANVTNTSLTFLFTETDGAPATGNVFFIMVPVIKTGLKEKTKTLKYGSFDATSGAYTHTGTVAGGATKGVKIVSASNNSDIVLDECDVFQVTRIVASKDSGTTPTTTKTLNDGDVDVTALYEFNDGQKEYYYDYGRVTLKPGYQKPAGKVRVEYDYFDHDASNNSDYFSVDSYLSAISYDEIPKFHGSDGANYNLADCIDFRKKITETTNGRAPVDLFTCDFFSYNGRQDKLVLDSKTKNFLLVTGTPGTDLPPEDAEYGMTLAELKLMPYGIGKESCLLKPRDNRRYTMRDIGRLEKRIENLEYYTSLSLLESETSKMNILDANGNNRFKNGFLADSFTSFESSDLDNDDFSCSISTTLEHVARPLVFSDNFSLEEDLSNAVFQTTVASLRNPTGSGTAYTKTGDLYTLPFTRTEFISQGIATKVLNVNPFAVFTYVGRVDLTPWSDVWRETRYSEITVFDDSAYQAALSKYNGDVNYDKTQNYPSTSPIPPRKYAGRRMLEGGHIHWDRLSEKERKEARKTGKFRVPAPYINQGELVPINRTGKAKIQTRYEQTWTTTTKTIREYFQSEVLKTGLLTTKALTKDVTTDIEYMRTREVQFKGAGFKPNINLYTFFDNRPVTTYCRPVKSTDAENFNNYSVVDVTNTVGEISILPIDSPVRYLKASNPATFDVGAAVGKVRVGCEVEVTTNSGIVRKFDIISVSSQYIICQEKSKEGLLASQFGGSLSTTPGEVINVKITKYAYGDQLQADGRGSVRGVFMIPSPNPVSIAHILVGQYSGLGFKTGQTQFTISSSSINAQTGSGISRGSANFESRGTLTTQEATITQTQLFSVSQHSGKEESTSSKDTTIYDYDEPDYVDPIAQTFTVRETGGCFITDVEVFFAKKPTVNPVPVRLELRTVSNTGIPERVIVGGKLGNIIKQASDVVVNKATISSSGTNTFEVLVDGQTAAETVGGRFDASIGKIVWDSTTGVKSDIIKKNSTERMIANVASTTISDMASYMIPTRFVFESPIYLEQNKQYAFVLLSDSDQYEAWVAQRGNYGPLDQNQEYGYYDRVGDTNVKIGTTESIDGQELYMEGNFFKSKNGAAWTPDDSCCMKFNLGKAKFRTRSVTASNPIANVGEIVYVNETVDWINLGSNALEVRPGKNTIRVLCPNHGASVGDKVRFAIDLAESDLRGFTKAVLQNDLGLEVVNTELDYFTVTTGSTAAGYVASATLAKQHYYTGAYKTSGSSLLPTVKIRINKRFDQLTLSANSFCPQGTSIEWTLQTIPGVGVNEYDTSGTLISRSSENKLNAISITPGVPVEFDTPMIINCPQNEPDGGDFDGAQPSQQRLHIQTKKSVIVKALLVSNNENISPVLDQTRLSATTLSNRLDNPTGIATGGRNNINNTDFDTLTIFNKDVVPSDKNIVTTGGVSTIQDVARQPAISNGVLNKLSFTNSTKLLTGKFKQTVNSKIVERASGSSMLVEQVNPGDKIIMTSDPTDERTVVRVVSNTKLILNAPFSSPFNESALALVGEYMEITTTYDNVAQHLSQLDSGKYITVTTYDANGAALAQDTRSCTNKLILDVQYTPEATGTKCKVIVEHLNTQTINPGAILDAGTITTSAVSPFTVTGVGTSFTSAFVGQQLYTSGSLIGTVASVASATSLNLTAAPAVSVAADTYYRNNTVTITQLDRYIDEIGYKGNSGGTRYICKKLNLDRASTALKISFDGLRDEYSHFDLYYRTELPNDSIAIDDRPWKKATFNIEVDGVLTPKTPEANDSLYRSYECTIDALQSFKGVQAKVVMRGGNSAKPPKIKNFRLIALDE